MRGISFGFFAGAVTFLLLGMVWGIVMSATQDHSLSPAHAHLNLIGGVVMAISGVFYHLVPEAAARPLARIHLSVAFLGVVTIVPGIVLALTKNIEGLAIVGSVLTLIAMLILVVTVFRNRAYSVHMPRNSPMKSGQPSTPSGL